MTLNKNLFTIILATSFIFSSCNEASSSSEKTKNFESHDHSNHDHSSNSNVVSERDIEISDVKNSSTDKIINTYLQIKNGLTNDNQEKAAEGASNLIQAFEEFDITELDKNQKDEFVDIMEDVKEHSEHIVKSPIDHQREHFEILSIDINDIISLLGTSKVLYKDFCPMFNNGKGAIWISDIKEIENPFYGRKMSKCGEVQKTINE